ncbi:hypothetical protein J2N86_06770 [Legionella lytica]|uniref:Ankyrin repeat-containing protein n=1 Tax=Legionella lytica TaxID=96232 RepID=A0ABY4YCX3_9GAMM|nr:hypothetical protein [Legionella lytica]USQ14992.1 hypothetical protein J2N86_06770 [Legionella lytica]
MPSQIRIINAVNLCLQQKENIEFALNRLGVCAGLAGLYVKYSVENKTHQFFSILERLANLPPSYRIGNDPLIDDFIIQIEKVYNPEDYSGHQLIQGDLDQILHVGTKALRNEFNFGLVAEEQEWTRILEQITYPDRAYYIGSHDHAIAVSFKDGKYFIYDPNYQQRMKEFVSAKEVIQELKNCFEYKDKVFGLTIRAFANPNASAVTYPTQTELHQIITPKPMSPTEQPACEFAAVARDITTMDYLTQKDATYWQNLTKAHLIPEIIELLLKQPKSDAVQKALLRSIGLNFYVGNIETAQKLIAHYQTHYTSTEEQALLKEQIQEILINRVTNHSRCLKTIANFSEFINLCEQLELTQEHPTYIEHLQFLTLVHHNDPIALERFLTSLSPEQLVKHIQYAAITNQQQLLDILLNVPITPEFLTTAFTSQVIEYIGVVSLRKLLDKGFIPDIQDAQLLPRCMNRKDKSIFNLIANAWAEQSKQRDLWEHATKGQAKELDLRAAFGTVSLLGVLVFLHKDNLIKTAPTNFSEDQLQSALMIAIMDGNSEMSQWLHQKILECGYTFALDTLEHFYEDALEHENLTILNILASIGFNVLGKNIDKLLALCRDNNDYAIIFNSFDASQPKVKQYIVDASLRMNLVPVARHYAQHAPQFFNVALNNSLDNLAKLKKLNQAARFLPPETLTVDRQDPDNKTFIANCFKQKLLHLAGALTQTVHWSEKELNELCDNLIMAKNEEAVIQLIKIYPLLKQRAELIPLLMQNNLLNVVTHLAPDEHDLTPQQCEELLIAALANNKKDLVEKFLTLERITTLEQPLMGLVEHAIARGYYEVIETLLQSPIDLGLDYKALFIYSCVQKQGKIANLILAKEPKLEAEEISQAIQHLFGELPQSTYFDITYQQSYGRLYQLLLKTGLKNPREELLTSIKYPETDLKFQKTSLYLSPLKRALKEENEERFNIMFGEANDLPTSVDENLLTFLQNPVTTAKILPLFLRKYTLDSLLSEALTRKKWDVVANLLEQALLDVVDIGLQKQIQDNAEQIIKAYIANLEIHFDKADMRPRLFNLLLAQSPNALQQIASAWKKEIQEGLSRIELAMIENNLNLDKQIYRHAFSKLSPELITQQLQCTQAIENYLSHRDKSLGYFAYLFDYTRGKTRAEHYENLIKSAETKEELYVIEYAILINSQSKQFKKDMIHGLQFNDEQSARDQLKRSIKNSRLVKYLSQLDEIIECINKKANTNDSAPTESLFQEELASLKKICKPPSPLERLSFFQAQEPAQTGFWHWLTHLFSSQNKDKLASMP